MSEIRIRRAHAKPLDQARKAAEKMARQLREDFDLDYEWDGHVLRFQRTGVDGELHVTGKEIRLDARPDPERSQARQDDDKILFIAAAPGDTAELTAVPDREKLPPGTEIASVKKKWGHATEVAIPIAYLDGMQGGPWTRVRINVAVDDLDEPSGKPTQIWWRPDWRTEQSYAGSGTFERKR